MKIDIENFKGISNITYELMDNKVNFLFGISGSGKSSIATALVENNVEDHVKVGKDVSQLSIKVNNIDVNRDEFKIFDLSYLDNVLISRTNTSELYNIIYSDNGNVEVCRRNYDNAIESLGSIKEDVLDAIGQINKIISGLKIGYKRNSDEYANTCVIKKVANSVEQLPRYRNVVQYNSKEVKWLTDGTRMEAYLQRKCPFCSRKLTDARINKIGEVLDFDVVSYEKITANSSNLNSLGITIPDWNKPREVDKFNAQIKEYVDVLPELNQINSYIDLSKKTKFNDEKVEKLIPSKTLKRLYPDIVSQIKIFNDQINSIVKDLNKLKGETNKLISSNIYKINSKLRLLGLPYSFVEKEIDADNKKVDFFIKHKEDDTKRDMSDSLSFGEKNLISLIFFLLGSENAKTLIIDDPASSFDDYRRKVIFDFIYELSGDKTVLVLSHDAVFAKYALFYSQSISKPTANQKLIINRTGYINYLENYDSPEVKCLSINDFGNLSGFVKQRLKGLGNQMNYIVAINLRMLYELEHKNRKTEYEYLSAILHKASYTEIISALNSRGKSESDVLAAIKAYTDLDYLPLSNDYLEHIDDYEYKPIESVYRSRESIKKTKAENRALYDELSNIIHMNSAQVICLNPYDYKYFSKFVDSFIKQDKN